MSETDSRPPRKRGGLFNRVSALLAALLAGLLLSILFEWIGITFFWSAEGHLHSQKMMLSELNYLSSDFSRSLLHTTPIDVANFLIENVHEWVFVKTGLQEWLKSSHHHGMGAWLFHYGRAYIESIIYVTITYLVRLVIILFTSPLFILAAIAGFAEGLMLRDLRKFGAGRESGFIYHHARRFIFPVMISAWILYLSLPFSVHPNVILVPAAFLFGLSICVTSASFKKYL